MSYSDVLAEKVRVALARVPRVREKKMFGSTAFMVNGKMCVSVGHNRLMCRIDPGLHEAATQRKGTRTVKMGKREYKGYVYVNEEGLQSKSQLEYWLRLSLDFNGKAKSSRARKRK